MANNNLLYIKVYHADEGIFENFILDAVIRTTFYKYLDPKEALVSNGILNRALLSAAGKLTHSDDEEINAQ